MDTLSHGLWGGLVFGRNNKRNYWWAFSFGLLPDLLSFGLFTVAQILGFGTRVQWSGGPPDVTLIPSYVDIMYNYTHSLIIAAIVFGLIWLIMKKPWLPLLAWPLHILFDTPVHSTDFYPTPFLWPLSNFHIDGISWSHPWIFFPNWAALIIGYGFWYYQRRKKKSSPQ